MLLLESGRDVSPTGRSPLNQEENICLFCRNNSNAGERFTRWKTRLTNMRVQPVTLGEFVGREGSYFLNRKQGEQKIFSFRNPILSLTRGHNVGGKPPPSGYRLHQSNEGLALLEDAHELLLADFAKIETGLEDYIFPLTLDRSVIVTILVDSTPGGMVQAVATSLLTTDGCTTESLINPTGLGTGGSVM